MAILLNNTTYLTYITYALIVSGYAVAMFLPKGEIPGYSCVVGGLAIFIVLRLVPLSKPANISLSDFIPFIPIIMVLGVVVWLLAISVKYSKELERGILTSEYTAFNNISFVLLLIQLYLLSNRNMPYETSIIAFVASFQIIAVFIMQMNLQFFTTDG